MTDFKDGDIVRIRPGSPDRNSAAYNADRDAGVEFRITDFYDADSVELTALEPHKSHKRLGALGMWGNVYLKDIELVMLSSAEDIEALYGPV